MFTVENLAKRFEDNNFNDVTVQCGSNKEDVTISLCSQATEITSITQCEYFLVYCSLPWLGSNDFTRVVEELNSYDSLLEKHEKEKEKLHAFYQEHLANGIVDADAYGFYSDWHKDVYGFRPR